MAAHSHATIPAAAACAVRALFFPCALLLPLLLFFLLLLLLLGHFVQAFDSAPQSLHKLAAAAAGAVHGSIARNEFDWTLFLSLIVLLFSALQPLMRKRKREKNFFQRTPLLLSSLPDDVSCADRTARVGGSTGDAVDGASDEDDDNERHTLPGNRQPSAPPVPPCKLSENSSLCLRF